MKSNLTKDEDYTISLFTGSSQTGLKEKEIDNLFAEMHRRQKRTFLISKGESKDWTETFGSDSFSKKKLIHSKDLNVINTLIEALYLPEGESKGLLIADLREVKDQSALTYLHEELRYLDES